MRLNPVHALSIATLSGLAIAGCNLALGLGGYDFTHGGGGAGGSSSSTSSSGSSSTTTSNSTGTGGTGTGGTGGHGGHGGAGGGPGTPVWAFATGTADGDDVVNAMALAANGHIYLTGRAGTVSGFNCPAPTGDAGTQSSMGGYLVELDTTGKCVQGLFFGAGAEGTGLALDVTGNLYLSGNFTNSLLWSTSQPTANNGFLVALKPDFSKIWFHQLSPDGANVVYATGVVVNATSVYVTGYMSGKVTGDGFTSATSTGGMDGYIVSCPRNGNDCSSAVPVFKGSAGKDQLALAIALRDADGEVAVIGSTDGNPGFNGTPQSGASADVNVMLGAMDASYSFNVTSAYGDTGVQIGRRLAFSRNGTVDAGVSDARLYFAGTYSPAIKLGNDTLPSEANSVDVFVARLAVSDCGSTTSCAPLNTSHFGSLGDETVNGLAVDAQDDVVVVGALRGPVTFGTDAPYASGDDIYVAKMSSTLAPTWIKGFGSSDDQAADAVVIDDPRPLRGQAQPLSQRVNPDSTVRRSNNPNSSSGARSPPPRTRSASTANRSLRRRPHSLRSPTRPDSPPCRRRRRLPTCSGTRGSRRCAARAVCPSTKRG
jgi:hypothetical protein